MRTTLIDCDHCGRRIDAPSAVVRLEGLGSLRDLAADLCEACASALRAWLRPGHRGRAIEPSGPIEAVEPFHPGSD